MYTHRSKAQPHTRCCALSDVFFMVFRERFAALDGNRIISYYQPFCLWLSIYNLMLSIAQNSSSSIASLQTTSGGGSRMKMKLAEIAPGMWFREHGSEAIHVKLSGPVIRGVAAVYKSANINTGIL